MKHLLAIGAAAILVAFAAAVVWIGRSGLTHFDIIAAGVALALAFAIAIPADLSQALAVIKPYLPWIKQAAGGTP